MPEMLNLQREMNRLFSAVGQKAPQDYPAVNIWEKDGAAVMTAELPGMDPEKMDISVSGDILAISGTAESQAFSEGGTYLRQERGIGNFKRNLTLPFQVDAQAVEAKYEKGVLRITLPRAKEDLPKKIKIS
ncbi:MAG: Hsp20/alpha crystallin family protein [Smithellaceae bacterium]|nr:Hsp20/alpha crystallin family protein [Syntrophaceae bacterium]MDD4239834.1 Hsp20/alpha crystallin family protein [Smithellaceae bacterium]NLX52595.1 Hsp20/alpha crystallin family protein [Deltaproteobacteria bacterium]